MKRKQEAPAGAPEWLVTYGDMVTLLLCFFIILFSMSEVKQERFQPIIDGLRQAFGFDGSVGTIPVNNPSLNTLFEQLKDIAIPESVQREGDSEEEGIEGQNFRVTDIREGIRVEIGGRITFDRFSALLKPAAESLVSQLAAKMAGHNTIVKVTGHATREPLPKDGIYPDAMDLSIARAKSVTAVLIERGVRRERIRIIGAGDTAPLLIQAYTEARQALNRRVEIVVTEELVDDYAGKGIAEGTETSDYGR